MTNTINSLTAYAGAALTALAAIGFATGVVNGTEFTLALIAAAAGVAGTFVMEA